MRKPIKEPTGRARIKAKVEQARKEAKRRREGRSLKLTNEKALHRHKERHQRSVKRTGFAYKTKIKRARKG
jgi:hypothetical protein